MIPPDDEFQRPDYKSSMAAAAADRIYSGNEGLGAGEDCDSTGVPTLSKTAGGEFTTAFGKFWVAR